MVFMVVLFSVQSQLTWGPYVWFQMWRAATSTISGETWVLMFVVGEIVGIVLVSIGEVVGIVFLSIPVDSC